MLFSKKIKVKKDITNLIIYKHNLPGDKLFLNKEIILPENFNCVVKFKNKYYDEITANKIKLNSTSLPNIFKYLAKKEFNNKFIKANIYFVNKTEFNNKFFTYKYILLKEDKKFRKMKLTFNCDIQVCNFIKFTKFYLKFFKVKNNTNTIHYINDFFSEIITNKLNKSLLTTLDIENHSNDFHSFTSKILNSIQKYSGLQIENFKIVDIVYKHKKEKKKKENKQIIIDKIENNGTTNDDFITQTKNEIFDDINKESNIDAQISSPFL